MKRMLLGTNFDLASHVFGQGLAKLARGLDDGRFDKMVRMYRYSALIPKTWYQSKRLAFTLSIPVSAAAVPQAWGMPRRVLWAANLDLA